MSDRCDSFEDPLHTGANERQTPWQDEREPTRDLSLSGNRSAPAPRASFELARIAEWLPRLGAVLWLERRARRRSALRATVGARGLLLLDHPALGALAECVSATAHTQVTPHGPREWLSFRDAGGEAQAKLFLLPDTDYLAWDEMTAASDLASTPAEPRWHAHAAFLRGAIARIGSHWQARLFAFDHHRLPWLHVLGAHPPLRISLLGLELAREIVRGEGAELISPLHAS